MKKRTPPTANTTLKVLLSDGRIIEGEVVYSTQYRTWLRSGGYRVDLNVPNIGRFSQKDVSFFDALTKIRAKLEEKGVRLLCWAACRSAWPSRMQRDMGTGIEVHELLDQGISGPSHFIFEYAPPETVGTVREQKEHAEQWLQAKLAPSAQNN